MLRISCSTCHQSQAGTSGAGRRESATLRRDSLFEARRNSHLEIDQVGLRRAEKRVLVNRRKRFPRGGVADRAPWPLTARASRCWR